MFYVAYNIYGRLRLPATLIFEKLLTGVSAVNQFFLSWWTAVGDAASMASDNVGEIVQLLDPLDSTNTVLDDVLITLTGVFALVPGAGFLFGDVDALSEKWTAFAQVRPV